MKNQDNANRYAEIRTKITLLEMEAKRLEPIVLAELGEEKGADTSFGRVAKYNTYIYTYSDDLKAKEAGAKEAIKSFTEDVMAPVKELKEAEQTSQEPVVKTSIRFTPAKEE